MGCEKIKEIDIPSGISELSNAFLDCSSLESIFIPSSVTVFNGYDDNADTLFDGCNGLTIYCEEGSEAEKYAIENNINYQYIFVNKWDDTFGYLRKYSGTGVVKYLGKSFVGSSGEGSHDYDYYSIVLDEPFYMHSTYYITDNSNMFNSFTINVTELKLSENETDMDFSKLTDKRISFTVSLSEVAEGSGIYFQPGDIGIYEWFDFELLDNNPEYSNLSVCQMIF